MLLNRPLLSSVLATAFIAGATVPALAHEITFAAGGLSATLNSEQNYENNTSAKNGSHSAGTHTALGGEVSLAYVWNVNSGFDIGFEGFYDFVGGLEVEGPTGAIQTVHSLFGGRVLPAFRITNNTKIYINLGYAGMDQTLSIKHASHTGFTETSTVNDKGGGFQYGAGVETMIYDTIGIRLAYTVQQGSETKISVPNNEHISYHATPTVYNFFFGAAYHFQF